MRIIACFVALVTVVVILRDLPTSAFVDLYFLKTKTALLVCSSLRLQLPFLIVCFKCMITMTILCFDFNILKKNFRILIHKVVVYHMSSAIRKLSRFRTPKFGEKICSVRHSTLEKRLLCDTPFTFYNIHIVSSYNGNCIENLPTGDFSP